MQAFRLDLLRYWMLIKSIGITPEMEDYEKRKMSIFNQLNFLGIITGIIVPFFGVVFNEGLPALALFVAVCPLAISMIVLWLNHERYYEYARLLYFCLYPIATSLVYLGKVDMGIELLFIMYGVLSVFFMEQITHIVLAFSLSAFCYFIATLVPHEFYFSLVRSNYYFYIFNHVTALAMIFYVLYLIKQENNSYHISLINKSEELDKRSRESDQQKHEIALKAALLEQQTNKLTELNQLKNQVFSVIAHDLKTPMYALRNLFNNMQQHKMPPEDIQAMLPGIVNEMNYTTNLMENLLQWAKLQMANTSAKPEVLDIETMIRNSLHLLQWQASHKQIFLETQVYEPVYCYADKEMVKLVLRNLLSNAIKFTPHNGHVLVGAIENPSYVEVFVQDNGIGIAHENLKHLFGEMFFTTKGTDEETGTGLGLKLCKDFLERNGGKIGVSSSPGKGSIFSFTLPRAS